jgi:hypothetical protein
VYLACSSDNELFIGCVQRAISDFNQRHQFSAFELVYPPSRIGGDLGKVLLNVLRVRDADLVIADLTPKVSSAGDVTAFNSGTMLELGLVVAEENRKTPTGELSQWGGKRPLPRVHMFCSPPFQRRDLTPILNEYSINPYSTDAGGEEALLTELDRILTEKAQQAFGLPPASSQDAGAFQRSGASVQGPGGSPSVSGTG